MRLTRQNVARLALPRGKSELLVFDDTLPGFGIRLRAGGKRTWIAQYRLGAKQRRLTLGSVETLDPDEARKRAKSTLAKVQLGDDPQTEKQEARTRASVTLRAIARQYLDGPAKANLRPNSYDAVERYLTDHWSPLGERALHNVSRADVASRLNRIALEKGPIAANRARAVLSALFTWAIGEGLAEANPVVGTNKAVDERARDHVVTDIELAVIWRACRDDDFGRIVRLLILTAQRRDEVAAMAWDEVDLRTALWAIPKERTKNRLPHDVPLSPAALIILADAPRRDGRTLVFGEGEGGFQGWSRAKKAMDERIANPARRCGPGGSTTSGARRPLGWPTLASCLT